MRWCLGLASRGNRPLQATEVDALRRVAKGELKRSLRGAIMIAVGPACLALGGWTHGPGPEPSWPWFLIIAPLFLGGVFVPVAGVLFLRDVYAAWRLIRRDIDAASVERFVLWKPPSGPKEAVPNQLSSVERLPFSGRIFSLDGERFIGRKSVPVFEATDRPEEVVEWGVSQQLARQIPAQVLETVTVRRRKLTDQELAELDPHITRVHHGGAFLVALSAAMAAGIAIAVNVSSYQDFNEWAHRYAPLLCVVLSANIALWAVLIGKAWQARKLRRDREEGWVIVFTERDSGDQA